MQARHLLVALLLGWVGSAAAAATLTCPDLAETLQVGVCPDEEELRYTFKGYCSDNARLYDGERQVCTDYALYRALKNISLWETRDGRFSGYLSCAPDQARPTDTRAHKVDVSKQGSVTRVACSYAAGVVLTHRTKARCVVPAGACGGDVGCAAQCE